MRSRVSLPYRRRLDDGSSGAPHVLIVGSGFAGFHCARRLEHLLRPGEARVTIASPVDYMLYSPLLPHVAAGILRTTEPNEVAQHYVRTFDLRRRCALYLTYYRYGDTRKRGMAMVEFKTAYRGAGFAPTDDELPDFLPMVLDFASLSPRGEKLLHGHRTDLELLRRALVKAESPYADVVSAVSAQLPRLGRRELTQVLTASETGPPREEVGLEPFAPPEYLAGYGAQEAHR